MTREHAIGSVVAERKRERNAADRALVQRVRRLFDLRDVDVAM